MTKELLSGVAIGLVFLGYAPYLRDLLQGRTRPHSFSWIIWVLVTGIVFFLQVQAGAGPGAWITFVIVLVGILVFVLSLKKGVKKITYSDIVFLFLAFVALLFWLLAKQPVISVVLLALTEMLGFIPTVRKSWNDPFSETLSFYFITAIRHTLTIFALREYNIVTWLYPVTWAAANGIFSVMLVIRRKRCP